jgi:hypothetical protein
MQQLSKEASVNVITFKILIVSAIKLRKYMVMNHYYIIFNNSFSLPRDFVFYHFYHKVQKDSHLLIGYDNRYTME